jgi:hypothetical protein
VQRSRVKDILGVDTRYHFTRENVEDGIMKIKFVKSVENDSNILKKTSHKRFMRNTKRILLKSTVAESLGIGRVLEFGVLPYVQLHLCVVYGYSLGILYIHTLCFSNNSSILF